MSHYIVRELTNGNLMKTNSEKMLVGDYENTLEFWKESVRMWKEESEKLEAKNVELEKKLVEAELIRDCNASQRDAAMISLKVACEALERLDKITVLAESVKFIIREALSKIKSEGL